MLRFLYWIGIKKVPKWFIYFHTVPWKKKTMFFADQNTRFSVFIKMLASSKYFQQKSSIFFVFILSFNQPCFFPILFFSIYFFLSLFAFRVDLKCPRDKHEFLKILSNDFSFCKNNKRSGSFHAEMLNYVCFNGV